MPELTHVDGAGRAAMVDVGDKRVSRRRACASARIRMARHALEAIRENALGKGDVLAAARLAGILAAKRVAELIPLAHPLPLEYVGVEFELEEGALLVRAEAAAEAKTGVEMEAMTAAAVAALTVYDMAKAVDREMEIVHVRLESKSGGRSGEYRRRSGEEREAEG